MNDNGAYITSRNGIRIPCDATPQSIEEWTAFLESIANERAILLIDEAQFLPPATIPAFLRAADAGADIVLAGLDADFRRVPFDISQLLLLDPCVIKRHVTAYCEVCGKRATLTQRLDANGQPVPRSASIIALKNLEGAQYSYEPRCRKCHILPD